MSMTMISQLLLSVSAGLFCVLAGSAHQTVTLVDDIALQFKQGKIHISIPNKENGAVIEGELGTSLAEAGKDPVSCEDGTPDCLQFGADLRLTVTKDRHCYTMDWRSSSGSPLSDCYSFGDAWWYGGPENTYQYWPFNNMTFQQFSYITKEAEAQAIAEPYWVTSTGFYVFVDRTVPLFIDSNNQQPGGLCLIAKQSAPYLPRGDTLLKYRVCTLKNARVAHRHAVKHHLGHPTGMPDQRMVRSPIWSTWVRVKKEVNDSVVRSFASEIVAHGFNNSQLEIDDMWETCYGSGQFDTTKFPNMSALSGDLHDMGFRVTLWNHPFVNYNCPLYNTLKRRDYLVRNQSGCVLSVWWDGVAGVVDFNNKEAAQWYVKRREAMMKSNGIDSLKMDAGESSWLPQIPKLKARVALQPNAATVAYVRAAAQFGNMVEVRSGFGTQDLAVFVRMLDKDSKWTFDNGLPTLITTLLQMNINGYTFVLPDMVGGNAYNKDVVTKELFIRWLQATTFMPSIQFSAAPWDFDDETVNISKIFTSLHYEYSGTILKQMEECVKSGEPVNMPIWWVAPNDKEAHSVWSEYLLGEDILVAPVVEKGAVARDIYLPKGRWRDEGHGGRKVLEGGQWVRNYAAPLDTLPWFTRVPTHRV